MSQYFMEHTYSEICFAVYLKLYFHCVSYIFIYESGSPTPLCSRWVSSGWAGL